MSAKKHFRWLDQQLISGGAFFLAGCSILANAYVTSTDFDIFGLILSGLMFVLSYRLFRIGAVASNKGMVVRNLLNTTATAWGDIARFEIAPKGIFGRPVIVLVDRHDHQIRLAGFLATVETPIAMRRMNKMLQRLTGEQSLRVGDH